MPWRRRAAVLGVVFLVGACGGGGSGPSKQESSAKSTKSTEATNSTTTTTARGGEQGAAAVAAPPPDLSTTTPRPATTSTTAGESCAVRAQAPPPNELAANFATALAFAPDGRLFFAERSGTVRVFQDGAVKTFATVSTVTTEPGGGYSERGLLGLAVSPTFGRDRFIYAFYSDADRSHQHVVRWRDCGGSGADAKVIIELPAGSDCCHKGGRLAFGPDGRLYVTLGDEHEASAAQNGNDVRGKVLRYNADGSVPSDNPFGPSNPVWAYGFRNPFGLAIASDGRLAVTVNGPTGDAGSPRTGYDTVVANVARGGGYQWPNCYGYSHPLAAPSCGDGQHEPDWSSESSTVAPTGAAFVDGSGPAGTAGKLVFCTLNAGMKILTPGSPHATVADGPGSCRLDVKQGPDHALYFSDTGHIYRLG